MKFYRKRGENKKAAASWRSARLYRPVFLAMLLFGMIWHSVRRKPTAAAVQPPSSTGTWWNYYIEKSRQKGPLKIPLQPFTIPLQNDKAVLKVLEHFGVHKHVKNQQLTIIDIGLPGESAAFAKEGYYAEAFEARTEGVKHVQEGYAEQPIEVQERIHLHQTALSNVSNTTLEIYDANDSSSLLESAVLASKEKPKFEKLGKRMETVQVNLLDSFITSEHKVVAMKIDTQGVEPEIFMGSYNLFHHQQSLMVILTEYCTRLRPYEELSLGPHLLNGLGYTCYLRPTDQYKNALTVDANLEYCGDFVCIHHERAKRGLRA